MLDQRLVERIREAQARQSSATRTVRDDLCTVVDEYGETRHVLVADAPN